MFQKPDFIYSFIWHVKFCVDYTRTRIIENSIMWLELFLFEIFIINHNEIAHLLYHSDVDLGS